MIVIDFLILFIVQVLFLAAIRIAPIPSENPRNCCNNFMPKVFIFIRLCGTFEFLVFILYKVISIDVFTVAINWINWWKKKSEPFVTNASYFNASVCWVLFSFWCFFLVLQFIMILANGIELYQQPALCKVRCEALLVDIMEYIFTKEGFLRIISSDERAADTLPKKNEISDKLIKLAN